MKKIFTLVFGVLFMLSCSDDASDIDNSNNPGGEGTITLDVTRSVLTDNKTIDTRTDGSFDLGDYTMTVNGSATAIPENGKIEKLNAGAYTIELTDLTDAANYTPTFDDPRYAGEAEVMVLAGSDTPAKIELKQVNTGVRFIYDNSLADIGLETIAPAIKAGANALDYAANREATGYFMPGELEVSVVYDGQAITIDGQESITIDAEAMQLWEVTLRASMSANGSFELGATINVIEDYTDERTWTIGTKYTIDAKIIGEGLSGQAARLEFVNKTSSIYVFDVSNTITLKEIKSDIIVKKVVLMGSQQEILIGRRVGDDIYFKYDTGTSSVVFRDEVGGVIPIGIVQEATMISTDADTRSKKYKQEYDLFLNGLEWAPIGGTTYTNPFKGSYDGGGNKIHELTINNAEGDYNGFFGVCDGAVISNITVASGSVAGRRYVAGVVARNIGAAAEVNNCVNYADVTAEGNYAGGVISQLLLGGKAENCINYGTVTAKVSEAGGVCFTLTNSNLNRCINYGKVTGRASNGGVCSSSMGNCRITDCHNYGNVEGNSSLGGVMSSLGNNGIMANCTNEGKILVAASDAGGIVGILGGASMRDCENKGTIQATGSAVVRMGGIAGATSGGMYTGSITNCINAASAKILNGYSRVGGIVGLLNQANVEECDNYADISGDKECVGGIVGENRSGVNWSVNYGTISGYNFIGGICGYNYQTGKIRMSKNKGQVDGATYTGGIIGTNWGTCSASINNGLVVGSLEYTGGLTGATASSSGYLVACYNTAVVKGVSGVGGVVGGMNLDGLVEACYSSVTVSGKEDVGGVCGAMLDAQSTIIDCYWAGYKGAGVGGDITTNATTSYFDNGTEAPAGVSKGWPDAGGTNWGVNPDDGIGENGMWWKNLGTKGTTTYPVLWWEKK